MSNLELVEKMNANRKQINLLEEQDWELGEKLLDSISTEEDCVFILNNLSDSVVRMYVADKLRRIRHAKVSGGERQSQP